MKLDKLGLAPRDLLGLVADARPDRIDLVEPVDRLELLLGHACLHPDGSRCLPQMGTRFKSLKGGAGMRVNDRIQQNP